MQFTIKTSIILKRIDHTANEEVLQHWEFNRDIGMNQILCNFLKNEIKYFSRKCIHNLYAKLQVITATYLHTNRQLN